MMQNATLNPATELDLLLEESVPETKQREETAFDLAIRPFSGRVVIYAAGSLGKRVLANLRETGIEVVGFADANRALWGRDVNGVPVHSPEEAVAKFGDNALFVIATWHPTRHGGVDSISRFLGDLGCSGVTSFAQLFWRYPELYLPYYMWDLPSKAITASERVRSAFALFKDDPGSQLRFLQQLRLRILGDFGYPEPPANHVPYFPGLFQPLKDDRFIDCGAFDGDTIRSFLEWNHGSFEKIVAFEPDPKNVNALHEFMSKASNLTGKVEILENAVSDRPGVVRFAAAGRTDSAISESGDIEVSCVTLDDALAKQKATFVKMDIEGAEMSALRGARRVVRRDRPILAVCVYHQQDHLWEVPLYLAAQVENARFAQFTYYMDGLETVCYAIPEERYAPR